jgi:hypothetical protein
MRIINSIRQASIISSFVTVMVLLPIQVSFAQQAANPPIDVSGHLDVRAVEGNVAVGNNDFQIGQFVLDLSSEVSQNITAAMEVAYASEARDVVLDEAYVEWRFTDRQRPRRHDPIGMLQTGLLVGQFDVPFGLDWRSYRSIDRHLVSVPMVIANIHRGWNDVGVQFFGKTTWANWALYAVNGFGTSPALRLGETSYSLPPLAAADGVAGASSSELVPDEAFGARAGLFFDENIEFGTSFAAGYGDGSDQQSRMFAFDATATFADFALKGEFISRRQDMPTGRENDLGYYISGLYQWGRQFGVLRGDAYRPDDGPTNFATSAGAGYIVNDNAQLRVEYRLAEGKSNDTIILQTAIAF